jgi:hypothetical protein
MKPDGAAGRQVALDFDLLGGDGRLARGADPAGARAVPRHPTVRLREHASQGLLPNLLPQLVGAAHSAPPLWRIGELPASQPLEHQVNPGRNAPSRSPDPPAPARSAGW